MSLAPTILSQELAECPHIPAVPHRRGWRQLALPWITKEQGQPPRPKAIDSPGVPVDALNTKISYVKTKAHEEKRHAAARITKRRQADERDLAIFAQQKRINPDFSAH